MTINIDDEARFSQWPKDRPRPTEVEYRIAQDRYTKSINDYNAAHPNHPDMSDFCLGLEFVMATYARACWWEFFFPNEKLEQKWIKPIMPWCAACSEPKK